MLSIVIVMMRTLLTVILRILTLKITIINQAPKGENNNGKGKEKEGVALHTAPPFSHQGNGGWSK